MPDTSIDDMIFALRAEMNLITPYSVAGGHLRARKRIAVLGERIAALTRAKHQAAADQRKVAANG